MSEASKIYSYRFKEGGIGPPKGWGNTFIDSKPGIKEACKYIEATGKEFVPHYEDTFKAYDLIGYKDVKVVFVGQDVYHTEGLAMGLSFGTNSTKIPPSLRNIYKELKENYPDINIPNHGDISAWCKQGVMLLNASLTTEAGVANAHKGIWMDLMESTIKTLTNSNKKIIWVLCGKAAQQLSVEIGDRGIILNIGHPSPINTSPKGSPAAFLGSRVFERINKILIKIWKAPINWKLPQEVGGDLSESIDSLSSIEDEDEEVGVDRKVLDELEKLSDSISEISSIEED